MNIRFEVIADKEQARELWESFSKHHVIDDEFDFRDLWTKELDFPFHFIVGYVEDKPIGLLALQQNTLKGLGPKLLEAEEPFLEFFGGIDTDDNDVFILPEYEQYRQEFFTQITTPAILTSLKDQDTVGNSQAEYYLDKYELDLSMFTKFEDILQKNMDGRSRQRLINRIHKIEKTYSVEVVKGTPEDLELLFQFSIDRFGERSSFHMAQRRQVYYDMMSRFTVDLFIIKLDGKPAAISFGMVYNKTYTTVNIGYNYEIRDISKFLVVNQLTRALALGCTRFDAGQGNNGWKEHFNFIKIPQYKLQLNFTKITK